MHRPLEGRRALAAALTVLAVVATMFAALSPSASAGTARHDYIVVLKGEPSARSASVAADHAARYGVDVKFTYSHALNGYAASISDARVAQLRKDPAVAYVERDATFRIQTTQFNPPSWGLDRIDQRSLPLSGSYTYTRTGSGVTAYIVDTGINFGHSDFSPGRAVSGYDAIDGGTADDCHGHGTHVAGTVGGNTYGVAKQVRLVAVRVLNCQGSGTTAQIVAGLDWVTGNHTAGAPAVANMSLGGSANSTIDAAVSRAISDGVTVVVAAGNSAANACNYSPARVSAAITVAASDSSDRYASFTNWGTCVDWFAPGVNITSAWIGSSTASNTISGTSMASPHTAGVAAQYLQSNPSASPSTVRSALFNLTTKNIINDPDTPNNDLLFTNL
ncbi:MAG TPA: S8 family peptidase [Acidimicrobiales bacterium]|jgi:subtilisin family serine protease